MKIKDGNDFFQQKDCDIHNQWPFFVYKMRIPKKWQIPLKIFWTIDDQFPYKVLFVYKFNFLVSLWRLNLENLKISPFKVKCMEMAEYEPLENSPVQMIQKVTET